MLDPLVFDAVVWTVPDALICWRRRGFDPYGRLCLTQAGTAEAALGLDLQVVGWVNGFRRLGSI
jgi:hypothetical protein